MSSALRQQILNFFASKRQNIVLEDRYKRAYTKNNPSTMLAAETELFGIIGRATREFCISESENIIIYYHKAGMIQTILSYWGRYYQNVIYFSHEIASLFADLNKKIPKDLLITKLYAQTSSSCLKNWKHFVMDQRVIRDELASELKLLTESPSVHPFRTFCPSSLLSCPPAVVSTYMRLLLTHPSIYQPSFKPRLEFCCLVSDSVAALPPGQEFDEGMSYLSGELNTFSFTQNPSPISVFQSKEYIELSQMKFLCDQQSFVHSEIPTQISQILALTEARFAPSSLKKSNLSQILCLYRDFVYPIYKSCLSIISSSSEVSRVFSEQFAKALFFPSFFENPIILFTSQSAFLPYIGEMVCRCSSIVSIFAKVMNDVYSPLLYSAVKFEDESRVSEIVTEINSIVECDFLSNPLMVLMRSRLYIPFQSDEERIGRAHSLVELAHSPSLMKHSIGELFSLVNNIEDKASLLKKVFLCVQNELLSQVEPNMGLERTIVEALSQYTENSFSEPLLCLLDEFSHRFDEFYLMKSKLGCGTEVKICLLPRRTWNNCLQKGRLRSLSMYDSLKRDFESNYREKHPKVQIEWFDPSSIVETQATIGGVMYFFLFNGVQFSIIKALSEGERSYRSLDDEIAIDCLQDQLETLISGDLIEKYSEDGKQMYRLKTEINAMVHRNYAAKYTSAEAEAMGQVREAHKNQVVEASIVRILKSGPSGINDLVEKVMKDIQNIVSVSVQNIQTQVIHLERQKYIKCVDFRRKIFEFVP